MPDADLVFLFIQQVFVPGVLVVGALVGVLFSILLVYLALLDMLDPVNAPPKGGGRP
jgi:hypothetical protein